MGRSFGGGGGFSGGFSGGGRSGGFSSGGGRSFGGGGSRGGGHTSHYHSSGNGFMSGMLIGSMLSGGGRTPPPHRPEDDEEINRRNREGRIALIVVLVAIAFIAGFCLFANTSNSVDSSTVEREALPSSATTETAYYTDEGCWITSSSTLESGMKSFYKKTGVQPYLYILENGSITDTSELAEMAEELYAELFADEGHFILVFCDDGNGSFYAGYYIGAQAESVLDDEAITIFSQYLKLYYYDLSLSEEELFSKAYEDTADRIMSVTMSPLVVVAVCGTIIVVVIAVVFVIRHRTKAKAEEQRRNQEILNTPLEEFGDKDLEDLEKKYTSSAS